MELLIQPYTLPSAIEFNFDELKTALTEKVKDYETAIYSDDQIKTAKADKASLNKLKKALNDERIRLEKEYMAPFADFKSRINEIIAIIDKPITAIDTQVKAYEEKAKQDKADAIRKYMMESYNLPYGIDIMKIFDQKWLNASVSMTAIKKEIGERVTNIADDLDTLENLNEYQDFAIVYYAETLNLRDTLNAVKWQKEQNEKQAQVEAERAKAQEKPAEPVKAEPVKEQVKKEEIPGQWVNFSAYLTVETAKKLKTFFDENGIQFKKI